MDCWSQLSVLDQHHGAGTMIKKKWGHPGAVYRVLTNPQGAFRMREKTMIPTEYCGQPNSKPKQPFGMLFRNHVTIEEILLLGLPHSYASGRLKPLIIFCFPWPVNPREVSVRSSMPRSGHRTHGFTMFLPQKPLDKPENPGFSLEPIQWDKIYIDCL